MKLRIGMSNENDIFRIRSKVKELVAQLPAKLRAELPLDSDDMDPTSPTGAANAPRSYLKVRGQPNHANAGAGGHRRNASQIAASGSDDRLHLATVPSNMPSNSNSGGPITRSVSSPANNNPDHANGHGADSAPRAKSPDGGPGHKGKVKSFHELFVEKQYGQQKAATNQSAGAAAIRSPPPSSSTGTPTAAAAAAGPQTPHAVKTVPTIPEDGTDSIRSSASASSSGAVSRGPNSSTPVKSSPEKGRLNSPAPASGDDRQGLQTVPSPLSPRSSASKTLGG